MKKKSLNKKTRRITWKNVLWCICTPIAVASVAVAIALPMKYVNRPGSQPTINDTITVETDKASLSSVGDTALVSANSSDGRKVTLSCKIDGIEDTTNYFNPDEGIVTYKDKEVSGKTITITASDGVATNQITKIDFNTLEDIITFIGGYSPSLALVNAYTMVSAESTQNYPITLSATIDSVPVMDTDVFNPADGKVTYKDNTFANKTIVIKASDGMASVEPTINIGFGAIPTPDVHYKAHWDSTSGGALEYGVQASATLSLTVYGEDTPITTGVTYDWKGTHDTHLNLNPTGVVTITSGLTASTTAQISAKLNGNEVDTITVSAFVEDTPIPAYNTVDCSGYLQSKNATETVIVTVTGHNYTLSATSNLDELDFTTATTPDQQANLDISAGVLDSGANTVTYTVSIESSSTTSDIAGNFALLLTPSNTNINTWSSGDIAIHPANADKSIYMTVDTNRVVSKSQVITGHITLFNFDTPITNLELADKTADNDNDKFDTTKWNWDSGTPDTFKIQNDGINGVWRLQVVANGIVSSNTVLITVQNSIVPDDTYWFMAGGVITPVELSENEQEVNITFSGAEEIVFGYSTKLEAIISYMDPDLHYVDVDNLPNLKTILFGAANGLYSFDVSHNPLLENLRIANSHLHTLDVTQNPLLTTLEIYSNSLVTIDLSHNPLLETLDCHTNFLTTLNLTSNPALSTLYCDNNDLHTIFLPNTDPDLNLSLMICDNLNLTDIYTMAMNNPNVGTGHFTIMSPSPSQDNNPSYTYHLKPLSDADFEGGTYSGGNVTWTQGDDW